jgi:hypothetical protein
MGKFTLVFVYAKAEADSAAPLVFHSIFKKNTTFHRKREKQLDLHGQYM